MLLPVTAGAAGDPPLIPREALGSPGGLRMCIKREDHSIRLAIETKYVNSYIKSKEINQDFTTAKRDNSFSHLLCRAVRTPESYNNAVTDSIKLMMEQMAQTMKAMQGMMEATTETLRHVNNQKQSTKSKLS
uniref:Uncharacterized protein n=1 Tax=Magallana gigas TaxID=29159 RepID=K1R6S1_MAGGI